MGIRTDQFMGLNKWARGLVKGEPVFAYTERIVRVYPDGQEETLPDRFVYQSLVRREESGESYLGMFEAKYPLHKYTFSDGRVLYELVQVESWSRGPVFFLALEDEEGNWVPESLWSEESINAVNA